MFRRLVPADYRDLLDFVSPAAFKVIDWKGSLAGLGSASRSLVDREAVGKLAEANRSLLPRAVKVCGEPPDEPEGELAAAKAGQLVLDVYFSQFFSRDGLLLDLRLSHFHRTKTSLVWTPSNLVHRFDGDFRNGMLSIYHGFYADDADEMRRGMLATGLIDENSSDETVAETVELLFSHFGSAQNEKIEFELGVFRDSFHSLFLHLKRHGIRLPSDFLFLGVYLVTLYWGLEQLDTALDVKKAFQAAWRRNHGRSNDS